MKSLVVFIVNPQASRYSALKLKKAVRLAEKKGLSVEVMFTDAPVSATGLAQKAKEQGASLVVACGGDGTVNEVINGIALSSLPIAVLPLGLTNVFAREMGIPINIEDAIETAFSGNVRRISLGAVKYSRKIRYFSMMVGIGFDAMAVREVNSLLKRVFGKAAYVLSALKCLSVWSPEELHIDADGITLKGFSLVASNISRYAGEMKIAPEASPYEPILYLYLIKTRKRTDILKCAASVVFEMPRPDFVEYLQARHINVKGQASIHADGDYIGESPCEIEAVADALRVVC